MKTIFFFLPVLLFWMGYYQTDSGSISGLITDSQTNTAIVNANVYAYQNGIQVSSAVSDASGNYEIKIPVGITTLKIHSPGYETIELKSIKVEKDKKLVRDISMVLQTVKEIEDVEVSCAKISENKNNYRMDKAESYANYAPVYSYDEVEQDFNTESYNVINENKFKSSVLDPLSTFSVDVDRASYGNVRRFLTQNQKPPVDAVRVEELINYFDYNYPQPTDSHPFSITIEGSKCPWNEKRQLVLVGLKGENINEAKIPANNLVFLLDVSGSMSSPEKLPLVKQSFKILVDKLRPEDRVAIVVYAGAAGCVLESTPGTQKERILTSLDNLQAGGSTAGGAGIELAYKIAKDNYIENGNNRVILATDGDFNVGSSSDAEMVRLIETKRDQGVFLTILGFGMGNYKDSKMEQMADAGNGNYAYIDNILEAKKMFGVELWGTLYTIAKDVKIQVEFNPAKVKGYRLIGYENRLLNKEDFNNDKKDAGEIGCGHTVTALYEIISASSDEELPGVDPLKYQKSSANGSNDLFTVKFRYKKPKEDNSILIEKVVKENQLKAGENLGFASAVAEFGMLLRNSEFKGNASYEQVLTLARLAKGEDIYGFRADFIKLVEMAELMNK